MQSEIRNSCQWKVGLTKTFRNRSGKIFNSWGSNLQNPSDRMCQVHIPDEGYEFIQADLAGAEALDVSFRCPPRCRFRQLFEYQIKPHVYVALHLFANEWMKETPYDAKHLTSLEIPQLVQHPEWKDLSKLIKNNHERYFIGKKTCHSMNYGKQAGSFRFDVLKESEGKIVLTLKQAEFFRDTYIGLFPEIFADWHQTVIRQLKEYRTLYNSLGYPLYFGGHVENDTKIREAIAAAPQSTVGCIANIAACDMQEYIEMQGCDWDLLNNKHDSLLVQAPTEEANSAARKLVEYMSRIELCSPFGEKFFMRVEVAIGSNWMKYDEEKNPNGMREVTL
mgnify:CR=1 FL=1